MTQVAPEVIAVEDDAAAHSIRMAEVLEGAQVNASTWWRWRNRGIDPHLRTLRKVRAELDRLIEIRGAASAASVCSELRDEPGSHDDALAAMNDGGTLAVSSSEGAENPGENVSRTEEVAA